MLQEFEQECATTRRVLERVPADQLKWKPHPKSMSLGQLALHVAQTPGFIAEWALEDVQEVSDMSGPAEPSSVEEILTAHEEGIKKTKAAMSKIGDEGLARTWTLKAKDGPTLFTMPKGALIRTVVLNHTYHHRGQLSVYLRLLNVPVPSIYGPSADENPMAAAQA
jgi:uncharacterized damage-inducible protein DinB